MVERKKKTSKERILVQATREFAAKGFDGARVDRIAAKSGLSKNMLYHWFGSKEGLYVAVLEQMYETIRERQQDFALRGGDPVEAMRQLIAHIYSALIATPEAIWLLNDENLHKGKHVKRSTRIRELYNPLMDTISEILTHGQDQGVFRTDIDPAIFYVTISSLVYHRFANQYTLEISLGVDRSSQASRDSWLAHITEILVRYCQGEVEEKRLPIKAKKTA